MSLGNTTGSAKRRVQGCFTGFGLRLVGISAIFDQVLAQLPMAVKRGAP